MDIKEPVMIVADYITAKYVTSDSSRTTWQWASVARWANAGYKATIEAATGSGKSRIGIHAIQLLRRDDDSRRVIIVVPTRVLKTQWETELRKWKLDNNSEVWVINSIINGQHMCDLLILDEIHRMAADTFSRVFGSVNYNFVLGLTATLKRLDAKDYLLMEYAPICHKLTMAQARANGWVANYREYWLGLDLNTQDRKYYEEIKEKQLKFFRVFGMDFDAVKRGTSDRNYCESIARRLDLDPEYVYIAAVNTLRYLRIMRKWLIEHPLKIGAAYQIIEALDRKTLTFGESISVANGLSEKIGRKAMAFHSQMEPIERETFKDKEYKTESGARRGAEKEGCEYKLKHGKHVVQRRVMKKIGGKSLKDYVLHKIANTSQLQTVTTAKALNEGFDFPGAELGITLSRSSSPTTYTQQTGRVVRLSDGKTPVMIHIYIKDTKDEKWLIKAGWQAVGALRVESVEGLLNHINQRENELN